MATGVRTDECKRLGGDLWAALCLHFTSYGFCRMDRTIRVALAMEAGISDHIWTLAEVSE